MYYGYGNGPYMWIFMVIFWILIVGGIGALIRMIVMSSRHGVQWSHCHHDRHENSALAILEERYAKGEIKKEEFEEKKKDLS
jgi:putative membrane protein